MNTKYTIIGFVVVALIAFGAYFYPKSNSVLSVGSPQGATFTTAKFFAVAVNLASPGANATSSSVLNTSGSDYYVTSIKAGCEGVGTSKTAYTGAGLATLQLSVGTSSTANPVVIPGNLVDNSALTIGTSTSYFTVASSTVAGGATTPGTNSFTNIWAAGSYMTFWFNATNTATCSVGVDAFSS